MSAITVDGKIDLDEVRDWYFTFGMGHVDPITHISVTKTYIKINGTYEDARSKMFEFFGSNWSHQYKYGTCAEAGCDPIFGINVKTFNGAVVNLKHYCAGISHLGLGDYIDVVAKHLNIIKGNMYKE